MAISLLSNLSYLGEDYNFSRDAFATIADMKAFDADYLPPMYLSYCEEDGKVYLYNDNNTEDAITGKWRVFGEGGEGADEIYVGDTQPTDPNITMWIDTAPDADNIFKYYDGTEYKTITPITKLELLADVELTDLTDGQFIKWDETEGKWVNTEVEPSIAVSDTEPTDENIKLWLDISEAYDPDYFAKDDVVSISPLQPTTDSNKVWIDVTSAKGVLKYKYGDTYKAIGGVSKLSELTDVDLTSITNNSVIKWNGTKWIATTIADEIIDDTTSAKNKVYSSSKVDEIIDGLTLKVDEKPTYASATGVITYKVGGVTNTTTNTNIKFYYTVGANNFVKKYETFFLDGVEYTHLLTGTVSGGGTAEDTTYTNMSFDDIENVKQALDKLYAKVYYVPLAFTSFVMTPSTTVYEKGCDATANDRIVFTWSYNKDGVTQKVSIKGVEDTTAEANTTRILTLARNVTSDYEVKITASDGESTVTKTVTILFQNKIYWGSSAAVDNYNSSFILALANKKFATSKAGNLSFNVADDEYGFLAMPSSFGSPTCVINNFETELEDLGTVSFTNASGYTENYKLYKTTQDSLGAFTATIK